MKKIICKDGTEYRGVVYKATELNSRNPEDSEEVERIITEDLKNISLKSLEIERITFVKNVDPKLRETLEKYADSLEVEGKVKKEFKIQEHRLNINYSNKKRKIEETQDKLYKKLVKITGIMSLRDFEQTLELEIFTLLSNSKYRIEDSSPYVSIVAKERDGYYNTEAKLYISIPMESKRYPQEGTYDIYREYDGELMTFGNDMKDYVLKYAQNRHYAAELQRKLKEYKFNTIKISKVGYETSVASKSASVDMHMVFKFTKKLKLRTQEIEDILKDIKKLIS